MSRMTRSNPRPTSDEHPLTEYEKVRARNMMRNNRIFQSLGIDAIASMIRKTNDVQEGTTNGVQEGTEDSQQEEEELRSIYCNASRKGDGPTSRTNKEDPGT
ncbi:hypothetical protein D1007_34292 [Hordeum vulgare]|nr:hypothetical protein D1007_34292 [Hordeum vulgare]